VCAPPHCRATGEIKSPSARFRNWRRRGPFRRRGRHIYVLFDQVPKCCRDQDARQLHAPVFQGQSGEQDGGELHAPVFQDSLFIIAMQQNFRNALTKRLRSEIGLNSPPIANENAACLFWRQLRHGVDSRDPEAYRPSIGK
jgi:hypothetical protein